MVVRQTLRAVSLPASRCSLLGPSCLPFPEDKRRKTKAIRSTGTVILLSRSSERSSESSQARARRAGRLAGAERPHACVMRQASCMSCVKPHASKHNASCRTKHRAPSLMHQARKQARERPDHHRPHDHATTDNNQNTHSLRDTRVLRYFSPFSQSLWLCHTESASLCWIAAAPLVSRACFLSARRRRVSMPREDCLLYTSDAADE